MVGLFVVVFVIFVFSLVEYVDRSEWVELNSNLEEKSLFKNRNKKYGAYQLRKQQPWIILIILLSVIVLAFGAIAVKRIDFSGRSVLENSANDASDTSQFVLNNTVNIETPPGAFNYDGNNGDNMPVAQDGADTQEDGEGERPQSNDNTARSANTEDNGSAKSKAKSTSPEQSIYDFEKQAYEQAGGAAERAKIQKEMDERKKQREAKEKQKQAINGGNGGVAGTNSGSNGRTMVDWDLDGRKAHLNDRSNVKVPGYTCGRGINLTVVVKVKVNSNGDVIYAKAPDGINACCKNQAETYAKKSRFEYSSKALQEGTITYEFQSQ